jgi:hypothetical protein
MINSYTIKAIPATNLLKVVLYGIFMKSEVELALLLIKTEKMKLKEVNKAIIDLSNFQPKGLDFHSIHYKIQQLLKQIFIAIVPLILSLGLIFVIRVSDNTHMKMRDFHT